METKIDQKSPSVVNNLSSSYHIKKTGSKKKIVLSVIATIFLLSMIYSFIEPFWIEQKHYLINDPDIPSLFDGASLVFLTDIHHGRFFSRFRVRNLVKLVNKINPDLVLLGGDYVEGSPEFIEGCFQELGRLSAALGVYGVLGNHDHWQGADRTAQAMISHGIKSIDNNAFWIRKGEQKIRVGGVGDHCEDIQNIDITVEQTKVTDFVILVSHSPDYAPEIKGKKVDLFLSGHTHGGQVTLFGLYAPKVPSRYGQRFRTGKFSFNSIQVIVSNGIGTVLLPIRFFARPQILVVKLKSAY